MSFGTISYDRIIRLEGVFRVHPHSKTFRLWLRPTTVRTRNSVAQCGSAAERFNGPMTINLCGAEGKSTSQFTSYVPMFDPVLTCPPCEFATVEYGSVFVGTEASGLRFGAREEVGISARQDLFPRSRQARPPVRAAMGPS